jgi:hypothetical protein
VRTTLNINDATLKALREQAHASGRPFKEVVEETLKLGLAALSKPRKEVAFRIRPHDLGLKAGFRGTSLNQLYDQLEAEADASGS